MAKTDWAKTLEIIESLKGARIGEKSRWNRISKRIKEYEKISKEDLEYFARLARIYKDGVRTRSRTCHFRLSKDDDKPPCKSCGIESDFYCSMNDAYFCQVHVVGHDKNETL